MAYQEMLTQLYSRARFGIRPGHGRILRILSSLGDPHRHLRCIHIIGTNGKGSTTAFLESILQSSGIRTGRYTSPHLVCFTERFTVNGADISRELVLSLARRVQAVAPPDATFFEIATAMALLCFAEAGVELALLEAGMGGLSDATTVANGFMTLFTPIDLDHSVHLGETVSAIAAEKGGGVRREQKVLMGRQSQEVRAVLDDICSQRGVIPRRWGPDFDARWEGNLLTYRGGSFSGAGLAIGIGGLFQRENAALALATAELLADMGYGITAETAHRGIADARWPGRMELFPGPPDILLDGAHNPSASLALAQSLAVMGRPAYRLLVGAMEDKDLEGVLAPLAPLAKSVYAVTPDIDRALPAAAIVDCCRRLSLPAESCGSVASGLARARCETKGDELIVVCGSLFAVGEARAHLLGSLFQPVRG
jgi:dihydrofolate synthase/folylpolyglutamate synthase